MYLGTWKTIKRQVKIWALKMAAVRVWECTVFSSKVLVIILFHRGSPLFARNHGWGFTDLTFSLRLHKLH